MGRFSALLRGGVGLGAGKEPGGTGVDTPRKARAPGGARPSASVSTSGEWAQEELPVSSKR